MVTVPYVPVQPRERRLTSVLTLFIIAAIALNFLTPAPALAASLPQAMTIPSGDAIRFLQLFPELKELPAPEWLSEGMRFTYAGQSAGVNDAEGVFAGGYLQYDVVAVDAKSVAIRSQFYQENTNGDLAPAPLPPSLALPAVGDLWLHPAVLVNAEHVANDELTIVRHQRQDGAGNSHPVVRFQSTTTEVEKVWEFDEETGVLIFFRMRQGDAEQPTQFAQVLLANQRQLRLPWQGRRTPTWVKVGGKLHYEGSHTSVLYEGTTTTLPYNVTSTVTQRSQRWSIAHLTAFTNDVGIGEQISMSGVGQLFGGMWLSTEALRTKPSRTQLDRDPITGAEITWQRGIDRSIILTERGAAFETVLVYDGTSGMLTDYQQTIRSPVVTTTVALTLAE